MDSPRPASQHFNQRVLRTRLRHFLHDKEVGPRRRALKQSLLPFKEEGLSAYFFGGLLRDLLLGVTPRDVDLVVADEHAEAIEEQFGEQVRHRNRFGGLYVKTPGWDFDVWPVGQTWAFTHEWGHDRTFEALPKTTFLNIEAIAVQVWPESGHARVLHENGFFDAFRSRRLEVNHEANPYPDVCVVRSLLIAFRLNFGLGPRLVEYVARHAEDLSRRDIEQILLQHYRSQLITPERMLSWIDEIRDHAAGEEARSPRLGRPARAWQTDLFGNAQHELWPTLRPTDALRDFNGVS